VILTLLACFTSDAQAVYHPKLGRWMQQDPLGRDTTMQQRLGTSAMPTNAFVPKDNLVPTPTAGYHDGMNMYEYVGSRPMTNVDPAGLEEWSINEGGCVIEAEFFVKIFWGLGWSHVEKTAYKRNLKSQIEGVFNNQTYKAIPQEKTYEKDGSTTECCPCPKGFSVQISIRVADASLSNLFDVPDWAPSVSKGRGRAGTFGVFGAIYEDSATYQVGARRNPRQPVAAHEFGHSIWLEHPGHLQNGNIPSFSDDDYDHADTDRNGRRVDGGVDLMGRGAGLRPFYFEKWESELNSTYSGCEYKLPVEE
jgi:hypothetical protein